MDAIDNIFKSMGLPLRLLVFVGLATIVHLLVVFIRKLGAKLSAGRDINKRKLRSVATLTTSLIAFALYFIILGLILRELGVSLTAYLASASVIGLAVGFGSQGIVQDVVTGLTIVFSDLIDVGDLVEVSGQTGIVKGITMRFVELENALGARVFIPNRTINNVINYPRGYIRCIVDVTLIGDAASKDKMVHEATQQMNSLYEQFPGILLTNPSIEGRTETTQGKEFIRLKFRIWPNRGQPIEQTFYKELLSNLKRQEPLYEDWMIAVYYEVEQKLQSPKLTNFWDS